MTGRYKCGQCTSATWKRELETATNLQSSRQEKPAPTLVISITGVSIEFSLPADTEEPVSGCRMEDQDRMFGTGNFYKSFEVESSEVCPQACYQDEQCVYVSSAYTDLGMGPIWLCMLYEEGTYTESALQDETRGHSWSKMCMMKGLFLLLLEYISETQEGICCCYIVICLTH